MDTTQQDADCDEKSGMLARTPNMGENGYRTFADDSCQSGEVIVYQSHRRTRRRRWRLLQFSLGVVLLLFATGALVEMDPRIHSLCYSKGLCLSFWDDWRSAQDASPHSDDQVSDPPSAQDIPSYVLEYAPLVYLDEDEEYWPGDMGQHLLHTTPELNYEPIQELLRTTMNLTNLDMLNHYEKGRPVYLTSNDNPADDPPWLNGEENIPSSIPEQGAYSVASFSAKGGYSKAPAVLIVVNKGNGIVDAFWFFFYSFNQGNSVLTLTWGNHIGDWEHTLIRFQHGKPKLAYLSEHNFGSAYSFQALEKIDSRVSLRTFELDHVRLEKLMREQPVVYSAIGTHAMYASAGPHPYALPLGLLRDHTSRGALWDPALNLHSYTYNHKTDNLVASSLNADAPTAWFFFNGHWGDKFYPLSDPRQYGFVGQYHWVNGPLGPRFKHLSRRKVCQGSYSEPCEIRTTLGLEAWEIRVEEGWGEGEDWSNHSELLPPGLMFGEIEEFGRS